MSGAMPPLPDLNRHAVVMADLAWVETEGSFMDKRPTAAIRAYLWAVQIGEAEGLYPSLNMWRAAASA